MKKPGTNMGKVIDWKIGITNFIGKANLTKRKSTANLVSASRVSLRIELILTNSCQMIKKNQEFVNRDEKGFR